MPYAEEVNYWQTGRSSPDTWIDRAKGQIEALGGKVLGEGFGSDGSGRAAFMLAFGIKADTFKIIWPVLQSHRGNHQAARIQAATMLYHYIKSVCLYAVVVGPRTAFFPHLLLPDGRVAAETANEEIAALASLAPRLMLVEK